MSNKIKPLLTIIFVLSALVLSFAFPRTKYAGTDFISKTEIPSLLPGWEGKDMTTQLGLDTNDKKYNFINQALAYQYVNREGKKLLFIVLDAGDFHPPKACFTSAGFKITELTDTLIHTTDHSLKAHTLLTEKGTETFLSLYWISVDKKIIHEWMEQKLMQFYFSIFNKKRIGLMVRLDISTKKDDTEEALAIAKQFINDLSQLLPPEQAEYIFGKK